MALMSWSKYFVTGVDIIDSQHRHLVKLINDSAPVLARSFKSNPEKSGELLDALTEYAIFHFATEAELMQRYDIDQRHQQHHLEIHGNFANTINSMRDLYEQGQSVTGSELLGFLTNWLIVHILGEDQALTRQIQTITAGQSPSAAFEQMDDAQHHPSQDALTSALVDLYALMTEQNRHLLEMNQELQEHRDHLEDLVAQRTSDLDAARKSAEAANRAKSAFIANLSHEIRTPMNAIVGLTWTLQEESQDPAQKSKLKQVSNSTQQLLAIINDLIDISRIESEQLTLEPVDFNLSQVVDHIIANHAGKARLKGLTFSTELPDNLPDQLHGDPMRIAQVISNFVSNAIKFTTHGGLQLRLRLENGNTPEQRQLYVAVEDTGIGIPESQSARIFQPFEQIEQSTRRRFGGTGLGLAISQRLVDMMSGRIGVHSQPGEGSTFWFEVPLTVVNQRSLPRHKDRPETAGTEVGEIDWSVIENTLLALHHLLAEDDVQCIALWREQAEMLKAAFGEAARILEDELSHYNFEKALPLLQKLLSNLTRQRSALL